MYFLLHTFSLTPKSACYILTGKWSNSDTYQENIPGYPYCLGSGGLTKHKCFICKLCLSVGGCPWPSVKKKLNTGLLNIRNLKWFILLLLILSIFKTKYFKTFTQVVFYWVTFTFTRVIFFWYLYFYSSITLLAINITSAKLDTSKESNILRHIKDNIICLAFFTLFAHGANTSSSRALLLHTWRQAPVKES